MSQGVDQFPIVDTLPQPRYETLPMEYTDAQVPPFDLNEEVPETPLIDGSEIEEDDKSDDRPFLDDASSWHPDDDAAEREARKKDKQTMLHKLEEQEELLFGCRPKPRAPSTPRASSSMNPQASSSSAHPPSSPMAKHLSSPSPETQPPPLRAFTPPRSPWTPEVTIASASGGDDDEDVFLVQDACATEAAPRPTRKRAFELLGGHDYYAKRQDQKCHPRKLSL